MDQKDLMEPKRDPGMYIERPNTPGTVNDKNITLNPILSKARKYITTEIKGEISCVSTH